MEFVLLYTPAGNVWDPDKLVTVWPLGSSAEEHFSPTIPSTHGGSSTIPTPMGNTVLANADSHHCALVWLVLAGSDRCHGLQIPAMPVLPVLLRGQA